MNILIIYDNEAGRLKIRQVLGSVGEECLMNECTDGESALELLHTYHYDCIFIGDHLAGVNHDLISTIIGINPITPVVVIISHADEDAALHYMNAGACDCMSIYEVNLQSISRSLRFAKKISEIERQRMNVEQEMRVSKEQRAEAQRIARIGSWELDTATGVFDCSPEMYRIFEVPFDFHPTLANYPTLIHPDDVHQLQAELHNSMVSGAPFNMDYRIHTPHGFIKYVNAQGYCVFREDKTVSRIIGIVQDITERKLTEQALIEAKRMTEESSKIKETFLANTSHEIRTPLNAIIGFTRLLMQTPLLREQYEYIEAIRYSGENLLVILNDILDLSKIEAGKLVLEETDLDPAETARSVVQLFRHKAEEKHLELIISIEGEMPKLIGDAVRLSQVLANLVSNAIKFTEKGFVKLAVRTLRNEDDKAFVEFIVSDSGIGIQPEKLSSVFESFTQASSDTTRKYGGTGLGLTIARSLIEMQQGTITVESTPGNGTTFRAMIPFRKAENVIDPVPVKQDESDVRLDNIRVLLVEDNDINRFLAGKILSQAGCKYDIAVNGANALEKLRDNTYDVVLMDLQMPEMDGYTATRIIRTEFPEPVRSIPVIALTAHAMTDERGKCFDAGMNAYVSKPFDPVLLKRKIRKFAAEYALSSNDQVHDEKIIDLENARTAMGIDDETLHEVAELFEKNVPVMLEELNEALKEKDNRKIKEAAHKMKPGFGFIGAYDVQREAGEIELQASRGEKIEVLERMITSFSKKCKQVLDQLREEMQHIH